MKRILNSFKAPGFCILLLLALGLAPQTQAADIYMDEYGFDPAYLEVMVGESVTWWNFDSWGDPHTTRSYSYPELGHCELWVWGASHRYARWDV